MLAAPRNALACPAVAAQDDKQCLDELSSGTNVGPERVVAYEDSVAYFKIHLAEKRTWVCTRLQMNRKNPLVWVPLPSDQVARLVPGRPLNMVGTWTQVSLDDAGQIAELGELIRNAYATVRQSKNAGNDD